MIRFLQSELMDPTPPPPRLMDPRQPPVRLATLVCIKVFPIVIFPCANIAHTDCLAVVSNGRLATASHWL
jgi:hypothetical protein